MIEDFKRLCFHIFSKHVSIISVLISWFEVIRIFFVSMSKGKAIKKKRSRCSNHAFQKKIKTEIDDKHVEADDFTEHDTLRYDCQYCNKIFLREATSLRHAKNCPNKKISKNSIDTKYVPPRDPIYKRCLENNKNNSNCDITKISISKNLMFKETEKAVDISIYEFVDDDEPNEKPNKNLSKEDYATNRVCPICKTELESPLELLRHKRDYHSYPKTQVPLEEIEKYFNSPNRDICPICQKPLKTKGFKSIFVQHLLVHTTGLFHECGICQMKFRRKDHMRAHEKRHIVSKSDL